MTFNLENLKVTDGQKSLAAYIRAETGKQVKPEQIALIDALRAEFRKDPKRVEEREAVKSAARERKEAALGKALDKARKLAESLGIDLSALGGPSEDEAEEKAADPGDVAPVTDIADARRKRDVKAAPTPTITPVDDDDFDFPEDDDQPTPADPEDTSAIEIMQSEDAFETDGSADDDVEDF